MKPDPIDFVTSAPTTGSLDVRWNHGARRGRAAGDPPIQVHAFDEHTFVMRQSKSVHAEAPFMYLFFGDDRAFLLDTGAYPDAERFPLRETVDGLVDAWLLRHPREGYGLVVGHSHAHYDHVKADPQFVDRPNTVVVGIGVDDVREFYGFTDWPAEVVTLDLGGRVLEVTGCPGHHETSIAVYDPWTGWLLTGDTVYPGRLYVPDFPAFLSSLRRLVDICESRAVTQVMGCHVEMSRTPRRDYPIASNYQQNEAPLQMSVEQLRAVQAAAVSVADRPGAHVFDEFVIYNGRCRRARARQLARGLWGRLFPPRD
jgi:glyoxylase-like metal-dependent hydrolase (beta-lactamase superfamily II)